MDYDIRSNLVSSIAVNNQYIIDYDYDASGERVYSGMGNSSKIYINSITSNPLTIIDSNDNVTHYIYGPKGIVAKRNESLTYYLLKDHLGSTRVVINENNQAISSYDYDAWGNPMNSTVSEECAYRYTGREYDDETGLHNFRARLYDSTLMRFYQVDPAEQFASPYVYCGNNPIGLADPDGLEAKFSGEDDVDILRRDLSKSFLAYPSTVDRRGFIHRLIGPPTGPITDEETSFWQVVDDPKVLVTLSFDNDGIGSDGQPIYGGVYEGNRNTSHWWNFSKYDYKAKHTVHRLSMQKYHEVGGCDVGSSWIFEFRESYIGVKLFPGQGYSNNNHMFSHDQAMAQCINKIEPQAGGSRLITNSELVNPGDYPLKYRRTMIDKCWWILNGKRAEWDIEHTTVGD